MKKSKSRTYNTTINDSCDNYSKQFELIPNYKKNSNINGKINISFTYNSNIGIIDIEYKYADKNYKLQFLKLTNENSKI